MRTVEPDLVSTSENLMSETVDGVTGVACDAYPCRSAALNGGYSTHTDPTDAHFGTLAAFGKDGGWMALPEYRAMLRMNSGDVLILYLF